MKEFEDIVDSDEPSPTQRMVSVQKEALIWIGQSLVPKKRSPLIQGMLDHLRRNKKEPDVNDENDMPLVWVESELDEDPSSYPLSQEWVDPEGQRYVVILPSSYPYNPHAIPDSSYISIFRMNTRTDGSGIYEQLYLGLEEEGSPFDWGLLGYANPAIYYHKRAVTKLDGVYGVDLIGRIFKQDENGNSVHMYAEDALKTFGFIPLPSDSCRSGWARIYLKEVPLEDVSTTNPLPTVDPFEKAHEMLRGLRTAKRVGNLRPSSLNPKPAAGKSWSIASAKASGWYQYIQDGPAHDKGRQALKDKYGDSK